MIRTGADTVAVREFDPWAEPLDQMVPRVLAQDLAARRAAGSVRRGPERRLYVAVDEFMAGTGGEARLTGRWWTLGPGEDGS